MLQFDAPEDLPVTGDLDRGSLGINSPSAGTKRGGHAAGARLRNGYGDGDGDGLHVKLESEGGHVDSYAYEGNRDRDMATGSSDLDRDGIPRISSLALLMAPPPEAETGTG